AFVPPPETVSSAIVSEEKWQETLSAVGNIVAAQGVEVSTEISAVVREIAFESGGVVTNGQLLVRLDTSSEEAQLRAVQAQLELARANATRLKQLLSANTISQSEFDAADATLKQNRANAEAIQATIEK